MWYIIVWLVGTAAFLEASPFVQDSRKVVREQAERALQLAGVRTKGLVSNVNEMQDTVELIKREMDELQRSFYAPRSPFARFARIAYDLERFAKGVPLVNAFMTIDAITSILVDPQLYDEQRQKLSTEEKNKLHELANAFDRFLTEMDSVAFRAMMQHTRKLLYEIAGLYDTMAHIRDYGGIFSEDILSVALAERMREFSDAARAEARALYDSMESRFSTIRSEKSAWAQALLSHYQTVNDLLSTIRTQLTTMQKMTRKIQQILAQMTKEKNRLIRVLTMLTQQLSRILLVNYAKVSTQELASVGQLELRKLMESIHVPLQESVRLANNLVRTLVQGMQEGLAGFDAFKISLTIDVVNPVVRKNIEHLIKQTRNLSHAIVGLETILNAQ